MGTLAVGAKGNDGAVKPSPHHGLAGSLPQLPCPARPPSEGCRQSRALPEMVEETNAEAVVTSPCCDLSLLVCGSWCLSLGFSLDTDSSDGCLMVQRLRRGAKGTSDDQPVPSDDQPLALSFFSFEALYYQW